MNFEFPNFLAAQTEIFLLGVACLALLAHLFYSKRQANIAYLLVQFGLIGGIVLTLMQFNAGTLLTFNDLFINDPLARLLKLFILITVFAAFYYSRYYIVERKIPQAEYTILGLFSTIGMLSLVSAHSFLTIYLGLELLSLPLYAMVALQRTSVQCTEAAMKYFIMGAMASGMLLYGMSMLYGATGHLDINHVAGFIEVLPPGQHLILKFGLVFVIAGLGFKFAAVPFHMWAPDVYTGAPTSVTLLLSSAPKLAAFGMLVRLLVVALGSLYIEWQHMLIVLSVLSMGLGNLFAIAQDNIKRMLAYSAIAHVGYLLLGFIAGTPEGYTASLFYVLMYSLMALGSFGMLVLLSRAGFECERLEDFAGLNASNSWLAFLVMILMFSMAGIPPTVGFFAKLMVLKALVDVNMVWLAALALAFAIIGVFYYIRIIKIMYFATPDKPKTFALPVDMQVLISINCLALLAFGLMPGVLLRFCQMVFVG